MQRFARTMNIHAMPDSSKCVKAVTVNASPSFPQVLLFEDSDSRRRSHLNFSMPCSPSGFYSSSKSICDDLASQGQNFVKVNGTGMLEVVPDVIVLCIKITSQKPDLSECRLSIKKREDYVMSVLKKNSVKDCNCFEIIHKDQQQDYDIKDDVNNETSFIVIKEICATVSDFGKYINVASTCKEKLDSRVEVSSPIVSVSAAAMEKATQVTLDIAKKNARMKALTLIQSKGSEFRSTLGKVLYIMEDSINVDDFKEYENCGFESLDWKKFNKRITVNITILYELKVEKDRNYKIIL